MLGLLLVLGILGGGIAGEGFETVGPGKVGSIEDVETCVAAHAVGIGVVAADDYHLAIVKVAGVAHTRRRGRLFSGFDFDPGEGGYGKDPHIGVLGLILVRNQVLAAIHVDVGGRAVRRGGSDGAGIHTEDRPGAACGLLVPGRSSDIIYVDNVHLRLCAQTMLAR